VPDLAARIRSKVTRSRGHDLWTGAKKQDGSGVMKVDGRLVTVRRVVWELAHGPLGANARVAGCAEEPACVRLEHLAVLGNGGDSVKAASRRGRRGTGSKRLVRPGVWKLTITVATEADGSQRRATRTVHALTEAAANRELAAFVTEITTSPPPAPADDMRSLRVDDAVELFLAQHLRDEKGREERTINDYRKLHRRWFSPEIGQRRVRDVTVEDIDKLFGRMRRAGLSRSQLNQAKSLYAPFFRWAVARRIISRDPMANFQLPTSRFVSRERTPPEVHELSLLLNAAVEITPEIAPVLALGAVTGMRRGELVGLRRDRIDWEQQRITVDSSIDAGQRVKGTKTRRERSLFIDSESLEMLRRHCQQMDQRAAECTATIAVDAFVFSLAEDCSTPMPPDFVTKRVGVLKDHLGIAEKRPETIELEDEALKLYRQTPSARRAGVTGPAPKGGMSFREIGERFKRSERWAALAVASAERREGALARGLKLDFDGSILALRKFTSSELLDAGFNISMVAQRQGHGPGVLVRHYSKARKSADRSAAEHLGRVVHGRPAR
jgi:integrase